MQSPGWSALPGPQHELAEEPTRHGDHLLYVDVARGEIWSRDFIGPPALLHRLAAPISAARPAHGGLVVVSRMEILLLGRDGQRVLATIPRDPARWQVNGLIVLADGSLILGLLSRDRSETGELLCVAQGTLTTVIPNVRASNGLCLDTERGLIWHVDTYARTLTRFPCGRIGDRVVVSALDGLPGRPDGICVAPNGDVWLAMWDGGLLARIDPAGGIRGTVAVPVARPTCPLQIDDTLLVTTARSPHGHPLDGRVLAIPLSPSPAAGGHQSKPATRPAEEGDPHG